MQVLTSPEGGVTLGTVVGCVQVGRGAVVVVVSVEVSGTVWMGGATVVTVVLWGTSVVVASVCDTWLCPSVAESDTGTGASDFPQPHSKAAISR